MQRPKADTDKLYITNKGGEKVLLQLKPHKKAAIINIAEYLNTKHKEDQFLNTISLKATKAIKRTQIQQFRQQERL